MSGFQSDRPQASRAERNRAEEFVAEVARILHNETKVVHCKRSSYDVYIGRPSKWGNPFAIGRDGDREEVMLKYLDWLMTQVDLLEALPELKGKILGCWCKPQDCHGDILARMANML